MPRVRIVVHDVVGWDTMTEKEKWMLIDMLKENAASLDHLSAFMRKIRGVGTNNRKRHADEISNAASMLRQWVREIEREE